MKSLDAATGNLRWNYREYVGKATIDDIGNSINILKNNVIYSQPIKTEVVAIDATDGTQKWKLSVKEGLIARKIFVNATKVLVEAVGNGYLIYLVDIQSGKIDMLPENAPFSGILRMDDNYIYTSEGAFVLATVSKQWGWPLQNKGIYQFIEMTDQSLYIVVPNEESMVYAFDIKTGQRKWNAKPPLYIKPLRSRWFWFDKEEKAVSVLVSVGTDVSRETLIGIDAVTGALKWEYKVGLSDGPIIINRATLRLGPNMFVLTAQFGAEANEKLSSIDMITGIHKWTLTNIGPTTLGFLGGNEEIIILRQNDKLKGVSQKTGLELWQRDLPDGALGGIKSIGDHIYLDTGLGGIVLDAKTGAQQWSAPMAQMPINGDSFLND